MADTVQQIKERLNIIDVVSQYVKLDRAGVNMRARCPFHAEKTPSFIVSPDRGTYHCFGCNVGGDMFSFVEAVEGVDFKGALKILADKAGVELVYAKGEKKDDKDRLFEVMDAACLFYQSALTDEAKKYLKDRGLDDATVRMFRLGWAGDAWSDLADSLLRKKFTEKELIDAGLAKKGEKGGLTDKFRNRILFPIMDTAGRVVAFSGRTFGEKAHPEAPKYLNSPETPLYHKSKILYGFDRAKQSIRKHNFAVLVEGQVDLVLSHQAGWGNTVAVSGTAFTVEHAALLKRMSENLVIALDADQAGFKAATRSARAALQAGMQVKVAQLPQGSDPADLISKEGAEAWRVVIRGAKDIITFLLDVLAAHAKDDMQLRRSVETIVLPFLADIQSPIGREQYEKEIAAKLGVSQDAVRATVAKTPQPLSAPATRNTESLVPNTPNRIKQAYGLLLWQESLEKPVIDTEVYAREFEGAIGKEAMDALRALPASEKETLRFFAEELLSKNGNLQRSTSTLLSILTKDRLQAEIQAASTELRAAEERGDEARVDSLAEDIRTLTSVIAKMS